MILQHNVLHEHVSEQIDELTLFVQEKHIQHVQVDEILPSTVPVVLPTVVHLYLNQPTTKDVLLVLLQHTYTMVAVGTGPVMVVMADQMYHVVLQKRQIQ